MDALTLVRQQVEGLYALCLMLESPNYVTCYVQDYWKKRYVDYLLAFEETRALPRFAAMQPGVPFALQQLARLFGITEAQIFTIEHDEIGRSLPSGMIKQQIQPFPTQVGRSRRLLPVAGARCWSGSIRNIAICVRSSMD